MEITRFVHVQFISYAPALWHFCDTISLLLVFAKL